MDQSTARIPTEQPPEEAAAVDNLLGLKILVVFMGVLLLVCMIAFFAVLLITSSDDDAEQIAEVPQMTLSVEEDEVITNMTLDGRDLALQIEGPSGRRIVIVNPYTADHKAVINMLPSSETADQQMPE